MGRGWEGVEATIKNVVRGGLVWRVEMDEENFTYVIMLF